MIELLALKELGTEELESLVIRLEDFEAAIVFEGGTKRVFLSTLIDIPLRLASLVDVGKITFPPPSLSVGLALPYPIPLFGLSETRRSTIRETFRRCAMSFPGMGLKLRVLESREEDRIRAGEFCERYWKKGLIFNAWKKSYEAHLPDALKKAGQPLFRVSMTLLGDDVRPERMLSCLSQGLTNKLKRGRGSTILCASEIAEFLRPEPRMCSICTSKVLVRTSKPFNRGQSPVYRAP
jgi:hypothetical protein